MHEFRRPVCGQLWLFLEQLASRIDRVRVCSVYRDQIVLAQEEADVDGIEIVWIVRGLAKRDSANDEEDVPVELLELDSGLWVDGLFDGQRVEVEEITQHRDFLGVAGVDVHPEGALSRRQSALERIYVLGARERCGLRYVPDARVRAAIIRSTRTGVPRPLMH